VTVVDKLVTVVPDNAPEVSSVAEDPSALLLLQIRISMFPSAVPPVPVPRTLMAAVQFVFAKTPESFGVRKESEVPREAEGRAPAPKVEAFRTEPAAIRE
jgi:hypothetical protein